LHPTEVLKPAGAYPEKTSDLKGSFNDLVDNAADNLKTAKNKVNEFVRKGEKTVEDLRNEKGTEQWTS
jgi:hypothetical protein